MKKDIRLRIVRFSFFFSWYTFPYQVNKYCVLDIFFIPHIIRLSTEKHK